MTAGILTVLIVIGIVLYNLKRKSDKEVEVIVEPVVEPVKKPRKPRKK